MINFFSKDLFVLIYYLIFLSVCGVLLFNSFKTEDKKKKNKKLIILVVIFITCNILPIYYNKIIYKEEIKGKIYLIGKSANSNDKVLRFYCYEKDNNEFRLVNRNDDRSSNTKLLESYYIADYINVKDKTAIFISKEGLNKDINKNTKITDKYGTKFSYVVDKNNKPIMYGESNNYIYFGLVNKPIDNDYYLLINNKKINW